ncbi:MAG: hypothetical protein KKH83_00475 [Candidatus Margulisbacteria bacterium]|nr:hypothetical protein [Candidatus Margulisiibacteriota bacterium]
MDKYGEYLNKIRGTGGQPDFDRMYENIEAKTRQDKVFSSAPGIVASLAVLFIAGLLYYFIFIPVSGDPVRSYVFEKDTVENDLVASYVFMDDGTF